jgi:DNA-binding CsgD family transcriptional regulator
MTTVRRPLEAQQVLGGAIAELALGSSARHQFRLELIDLLRRRWRFDLATLMHSEDDRTSHICAPSFDPAIKTTRILGYMDQFARVELDRAMDGRIAVDRELLKPERYSQLDIYREVLRPNGVQAFGAAIWRNRFGIFGFGIARTGRTSFPTSDLDVVNAVLPVLRLAEASFSKEAQPDASPLGNIRRNLRGLGLSPREQEVAALVARGLQNKEIAQALQISPITVRNQLARVFRKSDVSTRAELVYVLTTF